MGLCAVAVFLCIITPYICPSFPLLPLLPISYGIGKGIGGKRTIDAILCGLTYSFYYALICYPLSFICSIIPYHWFLLSAYSLFFFVYNRDILNIDTEKLPNALWFRCWLFIFWDPPLLTAFHIVSYFGGQLSAPLATIINNDICVGAFPCSYQNVLELYGDPYHIRAVINLCNESRGPIEEYTKYKIKYIQLATLDTTPPSSESISAGIEFIEQFLAWRELENGGIGRVFIHCKGGRGRSVTMALCWLLSQNIDSRTALKMIKSKRKVASTTVLKYQTVQHFIKKHTKKK